MVDRKVYLLMDLQMKNRYKYENDLLGISRSKLPVSKTTYHTSVIQNREALDISHLR